MWTDIFKSGGLLKDSAGIWLSWDEQELFIVFGLLVYQLVFVCLLKVPLNLSDVGLLWKGKSSSRLSSSTLEGGVAQIFSL